MRTILHVDMDAFYASVEQRDDPRLRGRPVVVGGAARRGVVCAASYEARPFGVRSAMPMAEALRRCPDAIVVPPRMAHYAKVSRGVFDVFHRFTPLVEGLSLDEAFLDVTASRTLFGDGRTIAAAIKDAIRTELALPASAGVAPSKFVAKVASDLGKPNGLLVVEDPASFLAPLPIERMWGVGPKTAPSLHQAGLHTLGDLAEADPERLAARLGTWGRVMHALARGIDPRPVDPSGTPKSIGAEETYDDDLTSKDAIATTLLGHAERVAARLVAAGYSARALVVKIKLRDFTLLTRRAQLPEPLMDSQGLYRAALELLERVPLRAPVRLTGLSATDLMAGPPPLTLFPDEERERHQRVDAVVSSIHARFGDAGVTRAALLGRPLRRS